MEVVAVTMSHNNVRFASPYMLVCNNMIVRLRELVVSDGSHGYRVAVCRVEVACPKQSI